MATWGRIKIRPVRTLSGTPIPTQGVLEAASQTFKQGALVLYNRLTGYLNECSANPTHILGVASRDGQNADSAGGAIQTVALAHPDVLFIGNIDNNGGGTGATARTQAGRSYGITKETEYNTWYVDLNKAGGTNSRVVVWDFWDADGMVVGDTLGYVIFAFDPQYFQGHHTS
jgi:hypothetical protein